MPDNISYTPDEVAKILKISRFTVYELIKRGELTGYRVGRKVRVEERDLEKYKQSSKKGNNTSLYQEGAKPENISLSGDGLIICGQDIILDILTRHLEKQMPHLRFLRQNIGSIDGLMALYHGTANVVTAHLWDGDSGDYNIPYIRRILPGHETVVINLVHRMEGFYVALGNSKEIKSWADLAKPNVRFINRECGSGARVLLDEQLRKLGIGHQKIKGYENEELSHLAVASSVARGEADVGLGIEKVATQVKDIEFIPLQKERYDIVLLKEDLAKPQFQALLAVIRSKEFKDEVTGVGGYDISQTGEIIAEI